MPGRVLIVVLSLTAGTALLMWMGELITQRGIGNGMSLIVFASVVSVLPAQGAPDPGRTRATSRWRRHRRRHRRCCSRSSSSSRASAASRCSSPSGWWAGGMYGGQSTYIPLKVNQSRRDPAHLRQLGAVPAGAARRTWCRRGTASAASSTTTWPARPASATWSSTALLIIGFAYFYTAITFDPAPAGRRHPQAGRLHPRHPARAPDRALPGRSPHPHHAAGRAVHRRRRPPPAAVHHLPLDCRQLSTRGQRLPCSASAARRSSSPSAWRSRR